MVGLRLQPDFDCVEGVFDIFACYTSNLRRSVRGLQSGGGRRLTEPKRISSTASIAAPLPFAARISVFSGANSAVAAAMAS